MSESQRELLADDALVLHVKNWQTADKYAVCFTKEHGKLRFIADCIAMIPATVPADADKYRARYMTHNERRARWIAEHAAELAARKSRVDTGDAVAAALALRPPAR